MERYSQATFCLHPTGDVYARKAFFDSVAVGCIPVLNEWQYYDLPFEHVIDYKGLVVNLPSYENIYEQLEVYPDAWIAGMRANWRRVLPFIQFNEGVATMEPSQADTVSLMLGQAYARSFQPPSNSWSAGGVDALIGDTKL